MKFFDCFGARHLRRWLTRCQYCGYSLAAIQKTGAIYGK